MRRFYADKDKILFGKITLSPEETHHLNKVDRFKKGDIVLVFDGEGVEYEAVITGEKNGRAVLEIEKERKTAEKTHRIIAGVCLPKKTKFESIIEKCTELNVDEIIPIISERTVVKINEDKMRDKLRRWQRKAVEAGKQSRRARLPKINELSGFSEVVKKISGNKNSLILMPTLYSGRNLKDAIKNAAFYKEIAILIGPEGDFTMDEVKLAEENGAVLVSLGKTVLRVETAVIYTVSVLNYELQN